MGDEPRQENPQQPEQSRVAEPNPPTTGRPESPEARRGREVQEKLGVLVRDQQADDIGMIMVWERAGLPDVINTHDQMGKFLADVLPESPEFKQLQEEWHRVAGSSIRPVDLDQRYRGALFQVICLELLRYRYRNARDTVVLSSARVQEFFRRLYPDKEEVFHTFSALHSIRGVSVPDALLVTVADPLADDGPTVFSEMQATLDTNPAHYYSEVDGLRARQRQVRVNGPLRLAYRQDTSLLTMEPNTPAFQQSTDAIVKDLHQQRIPVELERYPVPIRIDTFRDLAAQTTGISPRGPQRQ